MAKALRRSDRASSVAGPRAPLDQLNEYSATHNAAVLSSFALRGCEVDKKCAAGLPDAAVEVAIVQPSPARLFSR